MSLTQSVEFRLPDAAIRGCFGVWLDQPDWRVRWRSEDVERECEQVWVAEESGWAGGWIKCPARVRCWWMLKVDQGFFVDLAVTHYLRFYLPSAPRSLGLRFTVLVGVTCMLSRNSPRA